MTKWGELWEKSFRQIFVEAALNAIDDAGVDRVDSMFVGTMSSGIFVGQEHVGALLADYMGLAPIPSTRVESACASGGAAVRQGYIEVASGASEIVLVGGVEKMMDLDTGDTTYALATAADQEYEVYHGITFPGLYALIARAHMEQFGTTREQLAAVSVKNHYHGSMNPHGQYPFEVTKEAVLKSTLVADPLTLLDCSPITDGASAVILCPVELAKKITKKPIVKIIASAQASDTIALHSRKDITWLNATAEASKKAYQMADKTPKDIDIAEVHDCFTIAEICVTEALGFFERGEGGKAAEEGKTTLCRGGTPVNTSGGLKSKGHAIGATGVAQIVEITQQLRGDGGKRQQKDARVGLTQNMGGTGASTVVHILEKE
jgi:acetyl-CoA C-acetyltransferase